MFAENFTDFNNEIYENSNVNLNSDISLNQNSSNEEIIYENGILIKDKEIHIDGNNHTICGNDSKDNHAKFFNIVNKSKTIKKTSKLVLKATLKTIKNKPIKTKK